MAQDRACGASSEPKTFSIKMEVEPLEDPEMETAQDSTAPNNVHLHIDPVDLQEVVIKTEETELLDSDPEMQMLIDEEAVEFSIISADRSQAGDTSKLDHDEVIKSTLPSKGDGYKKVLKQIIQQPLTLYKCYICVQRLNFWTTPVQFLEHIKKAHLITNHMYMAHMESNITVITAVTVSSNPSDRASEIQRILIFKCLGCKKLFRTRDNLIEHIQMESACCIPVIPDIFLCCRYCDTSFLTAKDYRKHTRPDKLLGGRICACGVGMQKKNTGQTHECDKCKDVHSDKQILRSCKKFVTTDMCVNIYMCEQCPIAFKRQDGLIGHNRIFHRELQTPAATLVKNPRSLLKNMPSTSTKREFNISSQLERIDIANISTSTIVTRSVTLSANSGTVNPTINEQNIHPPFVQLTKCIVSGDQQTNIKIGNKFIVYKAKIEKQDRTTTGQSKENTITDKQSPTADEEVVQPAPKQQTTMTICGKKSKYSTFDQEVNRLTINNNNKQQSARLSPSEQRYNSTTDQEDIEPIINLQPKMPTIEQKIDNNFTDPEEDIKPIINQEAKMLTIEQKIDNHFADPEEDIKPIINQEAKMPTIEQKIDNNFTDPEEDIKPIINQEAEMRTIEQKIDNPIADHEDIKPIINQKSGSLTADQNDVNPTTNQHTSKILVNIFQSACSNILKPAASTGNETAVVATVNETVAIVSKAPVDEECKPGEIIVKTEIKEEPVDDYMEIDYLNEDLLIKEDTVESIDDFIANTDELVLPATTSCPNCKKQIEIYSEHRCPLKRFECTVCHTKAVSLSKYTHHYKKHGMHPHQCPACRKLVRRHALLSHIQSHLTLNYDCPLYEIKKMNVVAPIVRTFTCSICKEDVERSDLLPHWERHVLSNTKLKESCKSQRKTSNTSKASDAVICRQQSCQIQKTDAMLSSESLKKIRLKLLETRHKAGDCLVCKKIFMRISDLKRHLIEHLVIHAINTKGFDGVYKCDMCNEVFDNVNYKRHMREHAGLALYECQLCSKVFSNSSNFSKHKKVHGIMYMQCDMCKRKFVSRNMLEKHMEFHDKCSPMVCQECDKVFYFASTLRKHMGIHHRSKGLATATFRCNICNRRFTSMKSKWDHQWLEHSIRKVEADCPLCDEGYRNSTQLRRHLRAVHSEASVSLQKRNLLKRQYQDQEKD